MKRLMIAALLASAALMSAQAQTKKELVQKLLTLQQPGIEQVARSLVERPAAQMMQEAGVVLQRQVAADKRESAGKQVEAEVRKYVDESVPLVRDRAIKIAPTTIGPILEEKFSEDELKQLIAWFENPVNKKYQQLGPEMQNAFVQKLVVDARPVVDPKIQALDAKVRVILGVPPAQSASAPAATRAPAAKTPSAATKMPSTPSK
ncbi:MAG: DUF2059 domain-containing protein [Caldimonas sp.]